LFFLAPLFSLSALAIPAASDYLTSVFSTLVLLSKAALTAAYLSSAVNSFTSTFDLAASAFALSSASFFAFAFSFFF
jgi:hypothetical protein